MRLFPVLLTALLLLSGCAKQERPPQSAPQQDQTDKKAADAELLARIWVESDAPTFVFDGEDLRLLAAEKFNNELRLRFSFSSRHAGYGDRTGYVLSQIIMPHVMEVVVREGVVVSAVTDGVFDEMTGERF